jgi:hypothetical protein
LRFPLKVQRTPAGEPTKCAGRGGQTGVVSQLRIPPLFAARAPRVLGDEAVPWLAALPSLAAEYARKWGLTFEGEAMHGYVGVVQPARRPDGTPVVLKLGRRDAESAGEPLALSTWAGRGAVLLLDSARTTASCCSNGSTPGAPSTTSRCVRRSRSSAAWRSAWPFPHRRR